MVTYYSRILHQTWLGAAMSGGVPWLWPLFEVLHIVGLALVMGCVLVLDLRTLGVVKGVAFAPLRRLIPWGAFGFAINLVTGVGFYAGFPGQYMSWTFLFKMLLVALAGINVLAFHASGLSRAVASAETGRAVPPAAKLSAAVSLALWTGVIWCGRMLQVFSDTF